MKGGAVEGLASRLVEENQTRRRMELAVVTVLDEQLPLRPPVFPRRCSALCALLRLCAGRCTALPAECGRWQAGRSLEMLIKARPGLLRALHPDHLVAEGGDLTGWQQVSRAFGKERMVAHLHGLTHASPLLDRCYGHVLALSEYIRGQWLATSALDRKALLLTTACRWSGSPPRPMAQAVKTLRQQLELSADDFVVLLCWWRRTRACTSWWRPWP